MTKGGSLCRLPRRAARAAAYAARTPAVAATITVILAILGAGPALAAARASHQAPARTATGPAKVRYYIVPPPGHGSVPTLYSIAAATLGSGSLFTEIFDLNKGRLQPNGQRMDSPRSVQPGWILLLPLDASGPGVHFGPLPATANTTSRVVHKPSAHKKSRRAQPTAPASAAPANHPGSNSAALAETVIGGALLVVAVAGLGLVLRRRRAGGGNRRPPAHTRAQGPGGDWAAGLGTGASGGRPGAGAPAADAGWPHPDHSSWPANAYGQALTPDHPSWPASDIGRPVGATAGYGQTTAADGPDWPYPDHPSWPANASGQALTPDHPSWPASDIGRPVGATVGYGPATGYDEPADNDRPGWPYPDHPSDIGRPVADDDYPSWPATDPGGGWAGPGAPQTRPGEPPPAAPTPFTGGAGLLRRERSGPPPGPAVHHDPVPGQAVAQVPPARGRHVRVPAGYSGSGGPADGTPQRWSAQLARTTGPIPQTYYDLAFGDGRLQVVLTEPPGANRDWAGPGSTNVLQLTTGEQTEAGWQRADPDNADSVRVAQRILSDADQQAAAIRQEAASQAVAIREAAEREAVQIRAQTAAETAPIREGAEREAAEIREMAAAQAAAIREAAEREAIELRAHLMAMSAELARVAAYVTENLAGPPPGVKTMAVPVLEPVAAPEAEPEAGPAAAPAARPATAPRTRPATRPGGRPPTKPAGKPKTRQYKAMRRITVAAAVLVLFVGAAGASEIGLHGYKFFVFRSAGTGATTGNGLQEDQGPGQPDAPGTHHPKAAQHSETQHHPKAKSHGTARHGAKAQHGAKANHGKSAQKK